MKSSDYDFCMENLAKELDRNIKCIDKDYSAQWDYNNTRFTICYMSKYEFHHPCIYLKKDVKLNKWSIEEVESGKVIAGGATKFARLLMDCESFVINRLDKLTIQDDVDLNEEARKEIRLRLEDFAKEFDKKVIVASSYIYHQYTYEIIYDENEDRLDWDKWLFLIRGVEEDGYDKWYININPDICIGQYLNFQELMWLSIMLDDVVNCRNHQVYERDSKILPGDKLALKKRGN